MSDFAPQMHVRKVGNGYIATVTVDAKMVESGNMFYPGRELQTKTEEVVFESLESLSVFMFHHFEKDKIEAYMVKAKGRKKQVTYVDAYEDIVEEQEDGKNILYKRNYEKVFPDFNKKKT